MIKYLDYDGLVRVLTDFSSWVIGQRCIIPAAVIEQSYISNINADLSSYITVEQFSNLYLSVSDNKPVLFSTGSGYTAAQSASASESNGLYVCTFSVLDKFGSANIQYANFELSFGGSSVILTGKEIKVL